MRPIKLKLDIHVDIGCMYRVYRNQAATSYFRVYRNQTVTSYLSLISLLFFLPMMYVRLCAIVQQWTSSPTFCDIADHQLSPWCIKGILGHIGCRFSGPEKSFICGYCTGVSHVIIFPTRMSGLLTNLWMLTVMILSFWTGRSGQTVQTQIRQQSDQGLSCFQFHLHLLDASWR